MSFPHGSELHDSDNDYWTVMLSKSLLVLLAFTCLFFFFLLFIDTIWYKHHTRDKTHAVSARQELQVNIGQLSDPVLDTSWKLIDIA